MLALLAFLVAAPSVFPSQIELTFSVVHGKGSLRRELPHLYELRQSEPPNEAYVTYSGNKLDPGDEKKLRALKNRTVFIFRAPPSQAEAAVREAGLEIWKLAVELHGFIIDEDTNQIFSPARFHLQRLEGPQSVLTQVSIQSDQSKDGSLTLTTAGMAHLGRPELGMHDVPLGSRGQLGSLMNLTVQTLAEKPKLEPVGRMELDIDALKAEPLRKKLLENPLDGATRKTAVKLLAGNDGVIWFDFGPNPYVEQNRILRELFGSHDEMQDVGHDSPKVLAASAAARKRLVEIIRPRWHGPQDGKLEVKIPFEGREWMWVEVLRWKGEQITGVLDNEPKLVTSVKSGSEVRLLQSEVFDYKLDLPDGGVEGNTTARLLREQ